MLSRRFATVLMLSKSRAPILCEKVLAPYDPVPKVREGSILLYKSPTPPTEAGELTKIRHASIFIEKSSITFSS